MFFTDKRKERDEMVSYLKKQGYSTVKYLNESGDKTFFEVEKWSERRTVQVYRDWLGNLTHV